MKFKSKVERSKFGDVGEESEGVAYQKITANRKQGNSEALAVFGNLALG